MFVASLDKMNDFLLQSIKSGRFPERQTAFYKGNPISRKLVIDLFCSQLISRNIDMAARILRSQNLCYYTIGSAGHEGNVCIGEIARLQDPMFLHYRSGALFVQKSRKLAGKDIVDDLVHSLLNDFRDPIAAGRHKVFGSFGMNVPPQTSTIASHLPKAVGAALSIEKSRKMNLASPWPLDSVVICSFGDGSINHASAQAAFNTTSWCQHQHIPVPILFVCEDNGLAVSVRTPPDWVKTATEFRPYLNYFQADGTDLFETYAETLEAIAHVRTTKKPAFLHLKTVRLMAHAGSDLESRYRSQEEILRDQEQDPLLHSARILLESNYISSLEILSLYEECRDRVASSVERLSASVILAPKHSLVGEMRIKGKIGPKALPVSNEEREEKFGAEYALLDRPQTLGRLINWVLIDTLLHYKNTLILGEDVAEKGGIYNITAGLVKRFGTHRVFNTLLYETSILGAAIGFAHNGILPIPEIQFLSYVHNAEDQIRSEASTLLYLSNGQFSNPMVIRIAGLAYQGFGGHFHNENSLAVFRDIPGIVIACPSRGNDAVNMFRRCVDLAQTKDKICIFIEPIALYAKKDLYDEGDGAWLSRYPGPDAIDMDIDSISVFGSGEDIAIFTYGNCLPISLQATKILKEKYDCNVRVIDLRWLKPLRIDQIAEQVQYVESVLIVDECRPQGSVSEEILAELAVRGLLKTRNIARITAADAFVPIGSAAEHVLPQVEDVIKKCLEMTSGQKIKSMIDRPEIATSDVVTATVIFANKLPASL